MLNVGDDRRSPAYILIRTCAHLEYTCIRQKMILLNFTSILSCVRDDRSSLACILEYTYAHIECIANIRTKFAVADLPLF